MTTAVKPFRFSFVRNGVSRSDSSGQHIITDVVCSKPQGIRIHGHEWFAQEQL